ncbi:MAG: ParB/RepB/Spo0J family partition protein [Alphaproteobacteria bacterium]|nr:ParB/RepB/Spo0J family partition protein [Alphaproteobacteria bacterium]
MTAREPPPRLGRGLAALLGDAGSGLAADAAAVRTVPIGDLAPNPNQPRSEIRAAPLDELVASIRARGILQPLLARPHPREPGRYEIIAGERRWRAAQAAGLHEVPVLVRPFQDPEAMAASLVENLQREDLNPLEEAEGYRRLLDEFTMSQEALGGAVGKSRSHVANMLRLLNLPPRVQTELRKGAISAGHARALLADPAPEQAALVVIARGLNVRQTEALVTQRARGETDHQTAGAQGSAKDPDLAALERSLSARLGLKVEIAPRGRGGAVRIHFQTPDQLEGVLALLSRD